jgi:hypothetical protein
MRLWLSRTAGGTYLITRLPPLLERIAGSDRMDLFERPGEPVAVRHLCPDAMHAMYKIDLEPLQSIRIRLVIWPVEKEGNRPAGRETTVTRQGVASGERIHLDL